MPCLGAATQNNPIAMAFYRRLIVKGKQTEGGARRLHAQADLHSQRHDLSPSKWDASRYAPA
jgi:transposase